ncbi:hypothetical protein MPC4_160038 [Methylocella tundrae]|uniref:Uncharacterized protein n=1 Tax=Methylocella tundrae TaxID=227605 RepID=A0A8B6M3I7_METTU|nr:hypothetical protein MPC1_9210003 [Methylocella tundrae]VTZ49388.1 hypothetical protein MPC4_160038 [Methylocella tundrae]
MDVSCAQIMDVCLTRPFVLHAPKRRPGMSGRWLQSLSPRRSDGGKTYRDGVSPLGVSVWPAPDPESNRPCAPACS